MVHQRALRERLWKAKIGRTLQKHWLRCADRAECLGSNEPGLQQRRFGKGGNVKAGETALSEVDKRHCERKWRHFVPPLYLVFSLSKASGKKRPLAPASAGQGFSPGAPPAMIKSS